MTKVFTGWKVVKEDAIYIFILATLVLLTGINVLASYVAYEIQKYVYLIIFVFLQTVIIILFIYLLIDRYFKEVEGQ